MATTAVVCAGRRWWTAAALFSLALFVVGCGGDGTDPSIDLAQAHRVFDATSEAVGVGPEEGGFVEDQVSFCQRGAFGDQSGGMANLHYYELDLGGRTREEVAISVAQYWRSHGETLLGAPVRVDETEATAAGSHRVTMKASGLTIGVGIPVGDETAYEFYAYGECGTPKDATVGKARPEPRPD